MTPARLNVVMEDCANPSPHSAEALATVTKIAGRFKDLAEVVTIPLGDPEMQQLGLGIEPTILIDDLVVGVGQAPDAGYLVKAIKFALSKRCGCADGECCS